MELFTRCECCVFLSKEGRRRKYREKEEVVQAVFW
ncbi:hypothetical protein LINPERHAP1_LOCUS41216, partial [Linum perenne]